MILLKETAQVLGVGEQTLKRWVDEKRIECTYVQNEMAFEEKEVDDFVRKTGIKLVKPESYTEALNKFNIEMSIKNNTLNDEKIKELFESMNK